MGKAVEHLVPASLAEKMEEWRNEALAWKPWKYQERSLRFVLENQFSGLLLDPGLGKTSVSLAAVKLLLAKKLIKRALVIAPLKPVYEVWPKELSDWSDFHKFGLAILHGPNKDKVLRSLTPAHQIVLCNPEGLQWLMDGNKRVKALGADMLIIDESSKFKASNSARFHLLRKHLIKFKRRMILTGSPRPKNYLDLFSQIYILDRGATLGQYISHYRNQFFYPTGFEMREWEPLPDAPAQIDALVAPLVLRLDAEDYLKMPGKPERIHRVELPPAIRKEYDSMEGDLMSTLFNTPMVNSAAARSKCAQMANGSVYTDRQPQDPRFPSKVRPTKALHTVKADAVAELYEELQGEPLLLGIGYHHDVTAIRKVLGYEVPCINSVTTRAQAAAFIDDWNKGKLPLLMGHPASMGHGLNLQKCGCRHVGFYDIPDDYDLYDQFYRRVWRQGNKSTFVMKHHFVTVNTVDEAKMVNLKRKGNGQNAFLAAMKEYEQKRRGHVKTLLY